MKANPKKFLFLNMNPQLPFFQRDRLCERSDGDNANPKESDDVGAAREMMYVPQLCCCQFP